MAQIEQHIEETIMPKNNLKLNLRDMVETDIEDYVRWFTSDTEWGCWDAPWEISFSNDVEEERKSWTEYYSSVKDLSKDTERWKFEIEVDNKHIGWVSSYTDLDYLENKDNTLAIGIDIPEESNRGKGYGTTALKLFINYLKEHGHTSLYIQTWSGNVRMIKVIEKLGFKEFYRKKDYREVRGNKYDALTYKLDIC